MKTRIFKFTLNRLEYFSLLFIIISLLFDFITYTSFSNGFVINSFLDVIINKRGFSVFSLFITVMPYFLFTWLYLADRKHGYIDAILTRTGDAKYRKSFYLSVLAIVFATVFVYYILSVIPAMYGMKYAIIGGEKDTQILFSGIYYNYPAVYLIIYAAWQAFCSCLYVSLGMILSFFVDSYFLVIIAPFIYRYIVDLFAHLLGEKAYHYISMIFGQYPNGFVTDNMLLKVFTACSIFIVFQAITYFVLKKRYES